MDKKYDIIFIGSGACFTEFLSFMLKHNIHKRVLLIEDYILGGNCMNYTCLPLQYLFESAKNLKRIKEGYYYGIVFDIVNFNYNMFRSQMMFYIEEMKKKLKERMKKLNISMVYAKDIEVNGNKVKADNKIFEGNIIIVGHNVRYLAQHPVIKIDNHTSYVAQRFVEVNKELKRVVVVGNNSFSYTLATLFANLSNIEVFYILENKNFLEDVNIKDDFKEKVKERVKETVNLIENKKITKYKRKGNTCTLTLENYGEIESIDAVFVEGEKRSNLKTMLPSINKEFLEKDNIGENIFACGEIISTIPPTTANEFYTMNEILQKIFSKEVKKHLKDSIYIRGFPSIAYKKPDKFNKVIEIKGKDYPLWRLFEMNPEDIIRVYLHDNIITGYEVISLHADIIGMFLNVFIKHSLEYSKEHIFNPHYLLLLRKLES